MSNQVVLITGALTGIGRAAAVAFAEDGAQVIISGRREKEGQELAAELEGLGAEAIFVPTDVRNEDAVRDLVDRTSLRKRLNKDLFAPTQCSFYRSGKVDCLTIPARSRWVAAISQTSTL